MLAAAEHTDRHAGWALGVGAVQTWQLLVDDLHHDVMAQLMPSQMLARDIGDAVAEAVDINNRTAQAGAVDPRWPRQRAVTSSSSCRPSEATGTPDAICAATGANTSRP